MTIRGIDLSNYAGDVVTAATMRQIKTSQNVERAIIACQFSDTWNNHSQACWRAGFDVSDAYLYLYNSDPDWAGAVVQAQQTIGDTPIRRLWLDVEDPNPPADVPPRLEAAIAAATLPIGIYTRLDYWQSIGNPQLGSRLPLWVANWDGNPNGGFDVDFGGWLAAQVKQYAGSFTSYGVQMGLDSWES